MGSTFLTKDNICTKLALVFPKVDKVIYAEVEVCIDPYKIFWAIPIISWLLQSDSLCHRQCELAQIRPGLLFCAAAGEFELLIHCC